MEQIGVLIAGEVPPDARAVLLRHLQECRECWAELARLRWLADLLPRLGPPPSVEACEHTDDLRLAVLAAGRLPRDQLSEMEVHLAECPECTQVMAAARRGLEDYEELFGGSVTQARLRRTPWRERVIPELRLALSSVRRAVALLGATVAFLAECAALSLLLSHLLLWWLQRPRDLGNLLEVWPWELLPVGISRLAALAVVTVVAALVARSTAAALYRRATRPSKGKEGRE
jgi:anti-sigma factor RsiW